MTVEWARAVRDEVKAYNPSDLISKVAALQVIPNNAECLLRLESLANIVGSISPDPRKPSISVNKLRRICNNPPLSGIKSQEDPSEQPFTESLSFIGGSYIVFPGLVDNATYTIRHIARLIHQYSENFPLQFIRDATNLLGVGLTLCELVGVNAGLKRNTHPKPNERRVFVPKSSDLCDFQSACQTDHRTLNLALQSRGFDIKYLSNLSIRLGESALEEFSIQEGSLAAKPVVQDNKSIILAVPGLMLAALGHQIIRLCQEYKLTAVFAEKYRQVLWHSIRKSLDFQGHKAAKTAMPKPVNELPIIEGVFSLDTDKALYVSLTSDDLRDFDKDKVFGHWDTDELTKTMESRQLEVEKFLFAKSDGLNELTVLLLVSSLGRSFSLGLGSPPPPFESPRLLMSPFDLETISLLDRKNTQLLRTYAIASNSIRKKSRIFAWSELDEFYLYKNNQYSYYLSDESKSNFITISSGTSLPMILEAAEGYDIHAVPSYQPGKFLEVMRIYPRSQIPIYSSFELAISGEMIAFIIECTPIYVWVISPNFLENPSQIELTEIYLNLLETVAYWIWQFSPSLTPVYDELEESSRVIVIEIRGDPSDDWDKQSVSSGNSKAPFAEFSVNNQTNRILVNIKPSWLAHLEGADNQGERSIMQIVLDAILDLFPQYAEKDLVKASFIASLMDRHAPIGRKKKFLSIDTGKNPSFSPLNPPPPRSVQMSEKTTLLDEVGEHLSKTLGVPVGPIPKNDRTKVLEEMVDYFFQEIELLVSTLNPPGFLEELILHNESILHNQSLQQLTTPTRMECFGGEKDFVLDISNDLRNLYEAGQASRFIIEYVATKPPHGFRPASMSVYDRLQALSSEIILWAGISDFIHFKIADIDLSILESGRLGSNYQTLLDRTNIGFERHALEKVDLALDRFDIHWQEELEENTHDAIEHNDINDAFIEEFGYSLNDLTIVMAECYSIGSAQETVVKRKTSKDLFTDLIKGTGITANTVNHIIDMISLIPRDSFLEPPDPYRREDVYPWRYRRPLSYIMRPLIIAREDDQQVFLWGNLNLYSSMRYLVGMCSSGRYQAKAKSAKMRSLLASINKERGDEFNARVTDLFKGRRELRVDSEVKKIASSRLILNGDDLGDIDVLVIHPKRKKVLLVECKDLSVARNPFEMANEVTSIFKGKDRLSTTDRMARRQQWISNNLSNVLSQYSLTRRGRWKISSILVASEEMLSPYLQETTTPVISLRTLETSFIDDWIQN